MQSLEMGLHGSQRVLLPNATTTTTQAFAYYPPPSASSATSSNQHHPVTATLAHNNIHGHLNTPNDPHNERSCVIRNVPPPSIQGSILSSASSTGIPLLPSQYVNQTMPPPGQGSSSALAGSPPASALGGGGGGGRRRSGANGDGRPSSGLTSGGGGGGGGQNHNSSGSSPQTLLSSEEAPPGTFAVIDPASRRLYIPMGALRETRAVHRQGVPSLCNIYLSGRCRQGANCFQAHADVAVVEKLRAQALEQPTCCPFHGAVTPAHVQDPIPLQLLVSIIKSDAGLPVSSRGSHPPAHPHVHNSGGCEDGGMGWEGIVATLARDRVSITAGLRTLLQSQLPHLVAPGVSGGGQSVGNSSWMASSGMTTGAPPQLFVPVSSLCKLHLQQKGTSCCRFEADCKFVHVCREIGLPSLEQQQCLQQQPQPSQPYVPQEQQQPLYPQQQQQQPQFIQHQQLFPPPQQQQQQQQQGVAAAQPYISQEQPSLYAVAPRQTYAQQDHQPQSSFSPPYSQPYSTIPTTSALPPTQPPSQSFPPSHVDLSVASATAPNSSSSNHNVDWSSTATRNVSMVGNTVCGGVEQTSTVYSHSGSISFTPFNTNGNQYQQQHVNQPAPLHLSHHPMHPNTAALAANNNPTSTTTTTTMNTNNSNTNSNNNNFNYNNNNSNNNNNFINNNNNNGISYPIHAVPHNSELSHSAVVVPPSSSRQASLYPPGAATYANSAAHGVPLLHRVPSSTQQHQQPQPQPSQPISSIQSQISLSASLTPTTNTTAVAVAEYVDMNNNNNNNNNNHLHNDPSSSPNPYNNPHPPHHSPIVASNATSPSPYEYHNTSSRPTGMGGGGLTVLPPQTTVGEGTSYNPPPHHHHHHHDVASTRETNPPNLPPTFQQPNYPPPNPILGLRDSTENGSDARSGGGVGGAASTVSDSAEEIKGQWFSAPLPPSPPTLGTCSVGEGGSCSSGGGVDTSDSHDPSSTYHNAKPLSSGPTATMSDSSAGGGAMGESSSFPPSHEVPSTVDTVAPVIHSTAGLTHSSRGRVPWQTCEVPSTMNGSAGTVGSGSSGGWSGNGGWRRGGPPPFERHCSNPRSPYRPASYDNPLLRGFDDESEEGDRALDVDNGMLDSSSNSVHGGDLLYVEDTGYYSSGSSVDRRRQFHWMNSPKSNLERSHSMESGSSHHRLRFDPYHRETNTPTAVSSGTEMHPCRASLNSNLSLSSSGTQWRNNPYSMDGGGSVVVTTSTSTPSPPQQTGMGKKPRRKREVTSEDDD